MPIPTTVLASSQSEVSALDVGVGVSKYLREDISTATPDSTPAPNNAPNNTAAAAAPPAVKRSSMGDRTQSEFKAAESRFEERVRKRQESIQQKSAESRFEERVRLRRESLLAKKAADKKRQDIIDGKFAEAPEEKKIEEQPAAVTDVALEPKQDPVQEQALEKKPAPTAVSATEPTNQNIFQDEIDIDEFLETYTPETPSTIAANAPKRPSFTRTTDGSRKITGEVNVDSVIRLNVPNDAKIENWRNHARCDKGLSVLQGARIKRDINVDSYRRLSLEDNDMTTLTGTRSSTMGSTFEVQPSIMEEESYHQKVEKIHESSEDSDEEEEEETSDQRPSLRRKPFRAPSDLSEVINVDSVIRINTQAEDQTHQQHNIEALQHNSLGNSAFADRNFDQAIQHYSNAIQENPKNPTFYSNRSAVYAAQKNWKASAKDALTCVQLQPAGIKGYQRLAAAQIELGELDAAQAAIEKGLANAPDNSQLLQYQEKVTALKRSKAKAAVRDALEAIRLRPNVRSGYIHLAAAQIELNDWDAALHTIGQGLKLDPKNEQLLKQLQTVQRLQKQSQFRQQQEQPQPLQRDSKYQTTPQGMTVGARPQTEVSQLAVGMGVSRYLEGGEVQKPDIVKIPEISDHTDWMLESQKDSLTSSKKPHHRQEVLDSTDSTTHGDMDGVEPCWTEADLQGMAAPKRKNMGKRLSEKMFGVNC